MVRGLVFDLDGVLVHTDELHYRAWKALAGRLGLPFTREQGDRCRGVSRMGSLEILLEGSNRSYTEREKLRMAEEKNDCYRAQLQELTPGDVPERTVETLRELRRRGYRLGLASSSKNAGVILTPAWTPSWTGWWTGTRSPALSRTRRYSCGPPSCWSSRPRTAQGWTTPWRGWSRHGPPA